LYVSVPKNYSGMAFPREKNAAIHPDVVHPAAPPPEPPVQSQPQAQTADCKTQEKHPLLSLANALKNRKHGNLDNEDFLLIGLILLLLGKEGNEDVLLILAMLLLI